MHKKTIILDFDGVIHSYKAWTGPVPTDPPTEGAKEAIEKLREKFRVCVLSTRGGDSAGRFGIVRWLHEHGIVVDEVLSKKEQAVLMVDDRGYRFDGDWDKLLAFTDTDMKPWNR